MSKFPTVSLDCSFCGKDTHQVKRLITGPMVFICDECVEICVTILKEEDEKDRLKQTAEETKP